MTRLQSTICVRGEEYRNFFLYDQLSKHLREGWIVIAHWHKPSEAAWFLLEKYFYDEEKTTEGESK